jgi:hypothetical protein
MEENPYRQPLLELVYYAPPTTWPGWRIVFACIFIGGGVALGLVAWYSVIITAAGVPPLIVSRALEWPKIIVVVILAIGGAGFGWPELLMRLHWAISERRRPDRSELHA